MNAYHINSVPHSMVTRGVIKTGDVYHDGRAADQGYVGVNVRYMKSAIYRPLTQAQITRAEGRAE